MNLDKVRVVVRPRSRWEAIDLGFIMARTWWLPLIKVWLALTLPAYVLFNLLFYNHLWLAPIVLWWLKPIWERPLLHVLSQAFFGELPPLKDTLRALPKMVKKQGFASLTYRRFSLTRSMDLPVVQLENLTGKTRAKRLRILHGRQGAKRGTGAAWLTWIGVHVESVLNLAILALIFVFIPKEMAIDWQVLFMADTLWLNILNNFVYYLCISLIAPFYVAAGFSLYIHRRIWLEGWDIEIAFRRLQKRLKTPRRIPSSFASYVLVVGLFLGSAFSGEGVLADDREQAKAAIETVLAQDVFHDREMQWTVKDWGWFDWSADESKPAPQWLLKIVAVIAENARIVLWIIALTLVLLFLIKNRQWFNRYATKTQTKKAVEPGAEVLFGLDVAVDTLPSDVIVQVQLLRDQKNNRGALSLLYRATLGQLMAQYNVRLLSANTEAECVQRVLTEVSAELSAYFSDLTCHWQGLAYAHYEPNKAELDCLCQQWPGFFSATNKTINGKPVG